MKKSDFLDGPILPALLKFAIPVMMALFLQALYGAADLWAVGKFASSADMSAVSTASQVMLVVTGIITGISMGSTVLLGRRIGEKEYEGASFVFGGTFWILLFLSLVFTFILTVFAKDIASMANAPALALDKTVSYLKICGMGVLFIVSYNGISALFRGVGNSTYPLLFVFIACSFNIAGDIILIKFFHLGATGAAISTVFAQAISVVLSLIFIKRYPFPFKLKKYSFGFHTKTMKKILKLGLPIALLQMCNEIYYLILIGFVNKLGVVPSAGVGVAEKLIVFLVLIPLSYMSSISSFVAQNTGAKNYDRAKEGMKKGMAMSGILGIVMAYVLFFYGSNLSSIFNNDTDVIQASATFLKATSLECLILSIVYCFTGYFNGIGKTTFVMLQGFFVIFLVKIPYAYFSMRFLENKLINLGISTVLGALTSLVACLIFYYMLSKSGYGKIVVKKEALEKNSSENIVEF